MKKATSIRLFFIFAAFVCCMAYGGGYFFSTWQSEKDPEIQLAENEPQMQEQQPQTAESSMRIIPYEFVLCEEDGYILVYCADRETVYTTTDIVVDSLPQNLQKEIRKGKFMYSEEELYNFLESYSS